jgi:hypothetical protein
MAAARKYKNRAKRKPVLKGRKRTGNKVQGEDFEKAKGKSCASGAMDSAALATIWIAA